MHQLSIRQGPERRIAYSKGGDIHQLQRRHVLSLSKGGYTRTRGSVRTISPTHPLLHYEHATMIRVDTDSKNSSKKSTDEVQLTIHPRVQSLQLQGCSWDTPCAQPMQSPPCEARSSSSRSNTVASPTAWHDPREGSMLELRAFEYRYGTTDVHGFIQKQTPIFTFARLSRSSKINGWISVSSSTTMSTTRHIMLHLEKKVTCFGKKRY